MKYSDAQKLLELGLISREQCDAIIERLTLSPTAPRNYLLITLSSLGGLLVLSGIVLLISANWESISALAKQISAAALMLAFWFFGLRFLLRKENPRPILGESLCLIGSGLWLGNIALYGQIYQISSEPSKAIAAWFLGIFLLPWLVRLRGVFILSLIAAFIWIACKAAEAPNDVYYFHFLAFFTTVSALGIFLSNLRASVRERFLGYGPLAAWTAFPALIFVAQIFCWDEIEMPLPENIFAMATLVPATLLLVTVLIVSFRKKLNAFGRICAIFLGVFPSVPIVLGILDSLPGYTDDFIHAVMMGSLFTSGIASMLLGAYVSRKFYVNIGTLMILLAALALVAEVVGSLTSSGFTLILAGALMIVFGYFLERQRRKITAKIREASHSDCL